MTLISTAPTPASSSEGAARRRLLLGAGAAWLTASAWPAAAESLPPPRAPAQHFPFGPVLPARAIPGWKVTTHEGRATDLARLLRGQLTALQLIFTGCSAICPIQGALFAQAQREIRQRRLSVQLLSISIDPMGDSPAALAKWLRQFDAAPGWTAVAPQSADVAAISTLLGAGGEDPRKTADVHSGQVFLVDRRGALVFRTPVMPAGRQLIETLQQLSAAA